MSGERSHHQFSAQKQMKRLSDVQMLNFMTTGRRLTDKKNHLQPTKVCCQNIFGQLRLVSISLRISNLLIYHSEVDLLLQSIKTITSTFHLTYIV